MWPCLEVNAVLVFTATSKLRDRGTHEPLPPRSVGATFSCPSPKDDGTEDRHSLLVVLDLNADNPIRNWPLRDVASIESR